MNLTQSDIDVLISVMTEQIENPNRAVVNSQSSFVAHKLRSKGYDELAILYWNSLCMRKMSSVFPVEVNVLQLELDKIDYNTVMPKWGYSGT